MKTRDELLALLEDDPFGLLKKGPPLTTLSAKETSLVLSFEEIQNFVEEYGREPESNMANIVEFKLYSRLKAIRSDTNKIKVLKKYDFWWLVKG